MSENKIINTEKLFEIRDYKPSDENAICALFERVFGKKMGATESIRHWRWEFLENPVKEIFIKLAWDKERLVGQYTASPVRIYADGNEITAALSHDTMTDPQYGRRGIFSRTAEELYAAQTKAGHGFIYGFPNRNSIQGFEKNLNWRQIMPAPVHIRPIHYAKHIIYLMRRFGRRLRIPLAAKEGDYLFDQASLLTQKMNTYRLNVESEFGSWSDDLWSRCRTQHRLWVIRDSVYLNWRYIKRPESRYVIVSAWFGEIPVGYVVLNLLNKEFGLTLFVLDLVADINFEDAVETLIRQVIAVARISGALFVSALLPPGSKYRKFFRRQMFMPLSRILFPQPLYFGARCFVPVLNNLVFNPDAWFVSWGDNDVI